jgi:hypothetical protein
MRDEAGASEMGKPPSLVAENIVEAKLIEG